MPFHVIARVFDRKDVRSAGIVSYRGLRSIVVWGVDCVYSGMDVGDRTGRD